MDWTGYEVFDPGVDGPLRDVSRGKAREHYKKLMAEKEQRKAMLKALVARDGIDLDDSDASISALDHWYRDRVELDPDDPEKMVLEWYSVANDIALYLGDLAVERNPGLHWELHTGGKRALGYQRPVIKGFGLLPNKRYDIDFDRRLITIGHRQAKGMKLEDEELVPMMQEIAELAAGRYPTFDV